MIEALFWDNDGVLVDTEQWFFEITRDAFAGIGTMLTQEHWMRTYFRKGHNTTKIAIELGVPEDKIDEMIALQNKMFLERLEMPIAPRPEVRQTLESLHGKVRMAIVTGSSRENMHRMHQSTGLLKFFENVVVAEDFRRSKPAPDSYEVALKRMAVPADHCFAIEDSPRGLASAIAAGIRCVVVPTELTDLDACGDAYRIDRDVSGIVELVHTDGLVS